MSARSRMTHRAVVERNAATGTDAWGQPLAPAFAAHATLPCFAWSKSRRELVDGVKTAMVEEHRALFPLDADLVEADELASVTDRRGVQILSGRFRVDAIRRVHDHLEADLKRVQS